MPHEKYTQKKYGCELRSIFDDDGDVERILAECLERLDEDENRFTVWERGFLESLHDREAWFHFSDDTILKLMEIHSERVIPFTVEKNKF